MIKKIIKISASRIDWQYLWLSIDRKEWSVKCNEIKIKMNNIDK